MQLTETFWLKPVSVRLQDGREHTFISIEESLEFLENEWPLRNGRHQMRAIDLCRSAINRLVSSEVARETFVGACIEANMSPVLVSRQSLHASSLVSHSAQRP